MSPTVTAAEINTHVVCPRQYEYEHLSSISPRRSHPSIAREQRRRLLRDAIVAGLDSDCSSLDGRIDAARERLDEDWNASSYTIPAEKRYDRSIVYEAIDAYFERWGSQHVANLAATNETLCYTHDGITYSVRVDALIETDRGPLALRYLPTLHGIRKSWADPSIPDYRRGTHKYRQQIASLMTAAIAIRSLRSRYGIESSVDFAYVGLMQGARSSYEDGDGVTVDPELRRLGSQYQNESSAVADLLAAKAGTILNSDTEPDASHRESILENACDRCPYQHACPEFIESELSFTDRSVSASETIEDLMDGDVE